jgi:hypothetical protein
MHVFMRLPESVRKGVDSTRKGVLELGMLQGDRCGATQ